MTKYYVGDAVTANGSFDVDGVATDPAEVTLRILDPDGTSTDYTYPDSVQRAAAGRYYFNFAVNIDGVWTWRWETSETAIGVNEGRWYVRPTRFT